MMTMLRLTTVVLALIASASASPALVWNSAQPEQETVYTSASAEPEDVLLSSSSGTGTSVVFLLARGEKGMEGLTPLAPQLSRVAQLPPSHVYSHVAGVQSGAYLQKQAKQHESSSLVVSLDEWNTKLNNTINSSMEEETVVVDAASGISTTTIPSKTQIKQTKRAQQLEQANLLIVNVDAGVDPERLDAAVAAAVQHASVERVVLTAVRGVDEVKHERVLLEQRRLQKMHQAGLLQSNNRHRRLEQEEAQGDDANNNNYNSDMEGVYYVSLTPNILAGILFFFMFATVTWTGISCMGMIQGQEIYVHKMPTIGREA